MASCKYVTHTMTKVTRKYATIKCHQPSICGNCTCINMTRTQLTAISNANYQEYIHCVWGSMGNRNENTRYSFLTLLKSRLRIFYATSKIYYYV